MVAKTDCVLLCLDRETFLSVLGPLQEVIDHNDNMRLLDSVFMFQVLTKREKKSIYEAFEVGLLRLGVYFLYTGGALFHVE